MSTKTRGKRPVPSPKPGILSQHHTVFFEKIAKISLHNIITKGTQTLALGGAVAAAAKGVQAALTDFYIEAIAQQTLDQSVAPAVADVAEERLVYQRMEDFIRLHVRLPLQNRELIGYSRRPESVKEK